MTAKLFSETKARVMPMICKHEEGGGYIDTYKARDVAHKFAHETLRDLEFYAANNSDNGEWVVVKNFIDKFTECA